MRPPKLSIVTASYEHGPFLQERARSILTQTFQDFEWIVIDDGSRDDSPQIWASIASDDHRVRFVGRPVNLGMRATTNEAISLATGEYVYRAESDDSCDARLAESLVRLLDSHPSVGVAFSATKRINAAGRRSGGNGQPVMGATITGDRMLRRLVRSSPISGPSAMFRRRLLDEVGPFGIEPFSVSCDYHFFVRVAMAGHHFAYDPHRWAYRRSHGQNLSGALDRQFDLDDWSRESYQLLRSALGADGEEQPPQTAALLKGGLRHISLNGLAHLHAAVAQGDFDTARSIVNHIEREDPGATTSVVWRCLKRSQPLARVVRQLTY